MNTPGGNTITTGEHALSLMLALARNIPQAAQSMREGKWEKKKFQGTELFNKTLGIIGMGRIGTVVAERALGLKMRVLAYDPFITKEVAANLGVELVSLDDLLARSDFITLHTPKTKDTAKLLNREAFKKMKPGVRIINCARGGLIDEEALMEALKDGKVAGAALDVYETEPPAADWPLRELPNVICTPHLGASTEEAQANVAVAVCEQIVELLLYGTIKNAVNAPSVSQETMAKLKPYLTLAEALGVFQAQMTEGRHLLGGHRLYRRSLPTGHQAFDPLPAQGAALPGDARRSELRQRPGHGRGPGHPHQRGEGGLDGGLLHPDPPDGAGQ